MPSTLVDTSVNQFHTQQLLASTVAVCLHLLWWELGLVQVARGSHWHLVCME